MTHEERIKARFRDKQKQRPNHSTFINFVGATIYQNFQRSVLYKMFNKLVDKEDYAKDEKDDLFSFVEMRNREVEQVASLS